MGEQSRVSFKVGPRPPNSDAPNAFHSALQKVSMEYEHVQGLVATLTQKNQELSGENRSLKDELARTSSSSLRAENERLRAQLQAFHGPGTTDRKHSPTRPKPLPLKGQDDGSSYSASEDEARDKSPGGARGKRRRRRRRGGGDKRSRSRKKGREPKRRRRRKRREHKRSRSPSYSYSRSPSPKQIQQKAPATVRPLGYLGSGDHQRDLDEFINKNELDVKTASALGALSTDGQKKVMGTDGGENSFHLINKVNSPNGVVMSRIRKLGN